MPFPSLSASLLSSVAFISNRTPISRRMSLSCWEFCWYRCCSSINWSMGIFLSLNDTLVLLSKGISLTMLLGFLGCWLLWVLFLSSWFSKEPNGEDKSISSSLWMLVDRGRVLSSLLWEIFHWTSFSRWWNWRSSSTIFSVPELHETNQKRERRIRERKRRRRREKKGKGSTFSVWKQLHYQMGQLLHYFVADMQQLPNRCPMIAS